MASSPPYRHAEYSFAWTWLGNFGLFVLGVLIGALLLQPLGPGVGITGSYLIGALVAWLPRRWVRWRRMKRLFAGPVPLDRQSVLAALDVKSALSSLELTAGDMMLVSPPIATVTPLGRPHNGKLIVWLRETLTKHEAELRATGAPVRARNTAADSQQQQQEQQQADQPALPFLELVDRVLSARATLLVQRNQTDATLVYGGHDVCVFLEVQPGEDISKTLEARLEAALARETELVRKGLREGPLWVVLVGEPRALSELGLPRLFGPEKLQLVFLRIHQARLRQDGLPSGRTSLAAVNAMGAKLAHAIAAPAKPLTHEQRLELERQGELLLATDGDFIGRMRSALLPFAVLAGSWALLLLLGQLFGGFGGSRINLAMGAYSPATEGDGEWWRVLTGGHLHGGLPHLLSNLYGIVYVLGPVGGALGRWRTLVLFLLSSIGGGLATMLFSEQWAVGASGGVFGVMGAAVLLSWRHPALMPARKRRRTLLVMAILLAINVVMSFAPGISALGHFGGLATGLVLVASGLIRAGLPPLAAPETSAPRFEGAFKGLALGLGAATLASFVALWIAHRPWNFARPGALERRTVNGVSMLVPSTTGPLPERREACVGMKPLEPIVVHIDRLAETRPLAEALEAARAELAASTPKHVTWTQAPAVIDGKVVARAAGNGGTRSEHLSWIEGGELVSLSITWEASLPPETNALVSQMMASVSRP